MNAFVLGADPGETTGLFAYEYLDGGLELRSDAIAIQVHGSEGVIPIVHALIARTASASTVVIAVEQFVVGTRAGRSGTPHAGRVARAVINELQSLAVHLAGDRDCSLFTRTAALVKPWATDRRLEAAGLLDAAKGMSHARDAARHALYAAVHMGLAGDPLSRKAVAR